MKHGIYYAFWENEWNGDFLYYIEKVAKLGFDVLEIAAHHINSYNAQQLAAIRQCAKDNGIILTAGIALFPVLLPSSTDPGHSLTIWDASSSQTTLGIMLFATAVFLPLILAYSTWAFRIMRGKVTRAHVEEQARNGGGY